MRARRAGLKIHGEKKTFSERVCTLASIRLSLFLEVSAVWNGRINTGRCQVVIPWTAECTELGQRMLVEEFLIVKGSLRANHVLLNTFHLLIFQEF